MKKAVISILLAVCLAVTFMIAACNNNQGKNNPPTNENATTSPEQPEKPDESTSVF